MSSEKISRKSIEYNDSIKDRREYSTERLVWGSDTLKIINLIRNKEFINQELKKSQDKFLRLFSDKYWEDQVSREFRKLMEIAFDDEEFLDALQQDEECREYLLAGDDAIDYADVKKYIHDRKTGVVVGETSYDEPYLLSEAIISGHLSRMSPRLYERLLRIHNANFKEKQAEIKKLFPVLRDGFLKRISERINDGTVPIKYNDVISRIENIKYEVVDPFIARYEEVGGYFNPSTETVIIASSASVEHINQIFDHEMLHVISGRTDATDTLSEDNIINIRTGIHYGISFGKFGEDELDTLTFVERFRWLNEAITEDNAMKFNNAKAGYYRSERTLYDLLQKSGSIIIPTSIFLEAYFEDYNPDTQANVPNWKILGDAISRAYQPGFLVILDKYIEKNGISNAINAMRSNWRSILENSTN